MHELLSQRGEVLNLVKRYQRHNWASMLALFEYLSGVTHMEPVKAEAMLQSYSIETFQHVLYLHLLNDHICKGNVLLPYEVGTHIVMLSTLSRFCSLNLVLIDILI